MPVLTQSENKTRNSVFVEQVPQYYADLVDTTDSNCPIALQAYFNPAELDLSPDLVPDPLGDLSHKPAPHITHRYLTRVLFHVTGECAMYCRYCFRKSLLNNLKQTFLEGDLSAGLDYIARHKEIREVIFSGGDPFTISPRLLGVLLSRLQAMPHLEGIRFHTRVPVTDPKRLSLDFFVKLSESNIPIVVVTHFNHPRELTKTAAACVQKISEARCTLLNQSVLLKGVNADAEVLSSLSRGLFQKMGILPYYLHHPDRAKGTKHFQLSYQEGREIYDSLRRLLPGYLVPRYVVDLGDSGYKKLVHEL